MVAGAAIGIAVSAILRNMLVIEALAYGAVSGIFVSVGLAALYRGMAQTSAAVVAPPAAVFAALVPFGWDLIQGARPSWLALLGCAVAISFLGLSTLSPAVADHRVTESSAPSKVSTADTSLDIEGSDLTVDEWIEQGQTSPSEDWIAPRQVQTTSDPKSRSALAALTRNRTGLALGVGAGIMLGLGTICVAGTDSASGAWPAAAQRVVGFATMAMLATKQRAPVMLPKNIRHIGFISGITGTIGIICLVFGVQSGGDLGLVAVAGSMFPAVAILLSTTFDGDKIRWWQIVGIAGSIVGVSLIAISQ